MKELLQWKASWRIERYITGATEPYNVTEFKHNCGLHAGINLLFDLMTGANANHFDNSNAEIGVGDDDTAAAGAQLGLQAAVNTKYNGMEAGYPVSGALQRVDFRSSFADGEAQYYWKEFCVRNRTGGTNLNRKVSDQGEKRAGQTWLIRLRIELA